MQGIAEPAGVISTVRQQRPGLGQSIHGIHKQGGSLVVAYLAFFEQTERGKKGLIRSACRAEREKTWLMASSLSTTNQIFCSLQ